MGLTTHQYSRVLCYQKEKLNLIRVNNKFFENSKLLPWRTDHYIAIEKTENGYLYWNNYPLSEGELSENRAFEIYDSAYLTFQMEDKFKSKKYNELCILQYTRIANQKVNKVRIVEEKLINLRNALLILKVQRKRINAWLRLEGGRKEFAKDISFWMLAEKLISGYESLLTLVQLQIARKQVEVNTLNDKLDRLCETERHWSQIIQTWRI